MPLLSNGMMPRSGMGLGPGMGLGMSGPRTGLIRGLSGIKWGAVLTNTQRTLNLVNQAIPIYRQAKPMISNMKTARKIIKVLNNDNSSNQNLNQTSSNQVTNTITDEDDYNNPKFFI